jgi:hypothetical protein
MRYILTYLIIIALSCDLFSQNFSDLIIVEQKVKKNARRNTKTELDSLSDMLKLSNRDTKIRKFELEECKRENVERGSATWTPVGDFPQISGCPGIFVFSHEQKREGSHYVITFFYDEYGNIVEKEIGYTKVIY